MEEGCTNKGKKTTLKAGGQGLQAIINLKASINLGLSDQVTEAFSDIQPVQTPLVLDQVMKDPSMIGRILIS